MASSLKPRLSLQLPSFGLLLMLRQALLHLKQTTWRGKKKTNKLDLTNKPWGILGNIGDVASRTNADLT